MKKINFYISMLLLAMIVSSCGQQKPVEEEKKDEVKVFSVTTQTVKRDTFVHYIQVTGTVDAVNSAFISPQMNGQITKLYVQDGDRVSQGQLLVELNSSVLRSSIQEVQTQLDLATTAYEKQKSLWDQKIGSEMQYLQAKTQKEALEKKLNTLQDQLDLTKVTAPFAGIVENINVNEGELAIPGVQLFELVNLNQMKILADVSESYMAKLHKGNIVNVSFPDYSDLKMKAPIYRIGNVINPDNRTFKVEIRLKNNDEFIKPNMVSVLQMKDYECDTAIFVPSVIVKVEFQKSFLFVAKQENGEWVAKKQFVETANTNQNQIMITSGLNVGDKVIVAGYNQIADGSVIKLVK